MILAHGLGGSTDLPIPVTYALIGGAWALAASFVLLLFAWRRPRLDPTRVVVALPRTTVVAFGDRPGSRRDLVGAAGGHCRPQHRCGGHRIPATRCSAPSTFWCGWASFRRRWCWGRSGESCLRCGHYTASCAGLLRRPTSAAFVPRTDANGVAYQQLSVSSRSSGSNWLRDSGSVPAVRLWCAVYVVSMAVGAAIFGDEWFSRADPFEVYSDTVARLSPLTRDAASGLLALRSPLDGAVSLPVQQGTVAVLAVLLGSTAFDSIGQIPAWRSLVDEIRSRIGAGENSGVDCRDLRCRRPAFWCAARATPGECRVPDSAASRSSGPFPDSDRGGLHDGSLPHVLRRKGPADNHFAVGSIGQRRRDVLGLRDASVSYVLSNHPSVVAGIAVLAVVVGHLVGITLAHDASLRTLPKNTRLPGSLLHDGRDGALHIRWIVPAVRCVIGPPAPDRTIVTAANTNPASVRKSDSVRPRSASTTYNVLPSMGALKNSHSTETTPSDIAAGDGLARDHAAEANTAFIRTRAWNGSIDGTGTS